MGDQVDAQQVPRRIAAAQEEEEENTAAYEYAGYAETQAQNEISISDEDLQDRFIEADDSRWVVSNDAVDTYDQEWEDDAEWDEINDSIVTLHGNQITRKCMHMWGRRLCLCQFLGWMDSHKYKCTTTQGIGAGGALMTKEGKKQTTPWVHKLSHKKNEKTPKHIKSTYHMKASVNNNGKKAGAELKIKSEHKRTDRRLIGSYFGDYGEYDIEDIDLNEADSESISDKLADGWYDSNDAEEWLILNEAESEFDSEWEDNELWDEITPKITTKTGHVMKKSA